MTLNLNLKQWLWDSRIFYWIEDLKNWRAKAKRKSYTRIHYNDCFVTAQSSDSFYENGIQQLGPSWNISRKMQWSIVSVVIVISRSWRTERRALPDRYQFKIKDWPYRKYMDDQTYLY